MNQDHLKSQGEVAEAIEEVGAAISKSVFSKEEAQAEGVYTARCFGPREEVREEYLKLSAQAAELTSKGLIDEANNIMQIMETMIEEKWEDTIENLVTTVGKNFALDTLLAGSAYTAAWSMGLVNGASPTFAAGDTMASHAGWTENTNYSQASRPTPAWSAASAGSKATSAAVTFSINAADQTISGCFLNTVATKGGATGTLYSCGAFTGGNKLVTSGDTLSVTYTASL